MSETVRADVVVDLQYGDCGKGKVVHHLAKTGNYTHVMRYNGGSNAGHTIYHNGDKYITHLVPAGVFHGICSVIGGGCVVDVDKLLAEIKSLDNAGFNASALVRVSQNAHVTTKKHVDEECGETKIGTTRTGNGPAYRDKHARVGLRAEDVPKLSQFLVDPYDVLWRNKHKQGSKILMEGAQGFGLDVDWGDYPYVSSSNCTVAAAINAGVPPQNVEEVIGVAKPYVTYVGAKSFSGEHPDLDRIQQVGLEYGATTGRPRQVNWLNLLDLAKAANVNGVTKLIINKFDILQQVNAFRLYVEDDSKLYDLFDAINFASFVEKYLRKNCEKLNEIIWSSSPQHI